MITTAGKAHIKRYLAGQVPSLAGAIALGVGGTAAALGDQRLQFEVARLQVNLRAYDFVADKLIFKAQIPEEFIGKVYEIGLYSSFADTLTDTASQMISTFDQVTELWTATAGAFTWNSTNTRIGTDSLRFSLSASGTATASQQVSLDLSSFSPADSISVAYNATSNAASIAVRFLTDSSNYFTATITPTTGYAVGSVNKGSVTVNGSPDWSNITEVQVIATASGGGSTTIDIDAVQIQDNDFVNPELVLVSREVVSPITKAASTVSEIEFSMGVTV